MWVGADPGGKNKFGLAIIREDGTVETACRTNANQAADWVIEQCRGLPLGVGVDAPLWWGGGLSTDRTVDLLVRKALKSRELSTAGRVQTINSLRGAVLIQGFLFVQNLFDHYGAKLLVTETHPKPGLEFLSDDDFNDLKLDGSLRDQFRKTDHERDAVVSAIVAREAFSDRSTSWVDLLADYKPANGERDPHMNYPSRIHYFWPGNR